jgi:aminomethyltransferase
MAVTYLFELAGRGRIKASGEDRKRLLHAMTTNHVQQLEPGQGCYAFFLSAQGRILADVNVLAQPDHLLLDVAPERRAFVYGHLDKYIIADDVTLEDISDLQTTLAVEGPDAGRILASIDAPVPEKALDSFVWADRLVVHQTYSGIPGYHIYLPPLDAPVLRETLLDAGAKEIGTEEVEMLRVANGKPLYGVDIAESHLPQETRLAEALHFSKGCYLGQEIVERIRSRGHVNKFLTHLRADGEAPPAHTKILAGEREVGEITSAAGGFALGYVRADALQGGAELRAGGRLLQPV